MSAIAEAVRLIRRLSEAADIPALDGLTSPDEDIVAMTLADLELATARAYHGPRRQYDVLLAAVAAARVAQLEIAGLRACQALDEGDLRDYRRELRDALAFVSESRSHCQSTGRSYPPSYDSAFFRSRYGPNWRLYI